MMNNPDVDNGRLRKMVGRLLHHHHHNHHHHHHHSHHSHTPSECNSNICSGSNSPARSSHLAGSGTCTPRSKSQNKQAALSLELWNAAYNNLRDNPSSAGLTTTYESIISQELPDDLKMGGLNSSFRGRSDEERLKLFTAIAEAGLHKTRALKSPEVDDSVRVILDSSKDTIESVLAVYPSSAVAWAGICTLTPLLLDPIIQLNDMRSGAMHAMGRITWYMSLPLLLQPTSWTDANDFRLHQDKTRDALQHLYRKVLEFEMNCVCATASVWNKAAKNVVVWNRLGSLVSGIRDADAEIGVLIEKYATEPVKYGLLQLDRDLDLPTSVLSTESEDCVMVPAVDGTGAVSSEASVMPGPTNSVGPV